MWLGLAGGLALGTKESALGFLLIIPVALAVEGWRGEIVHVVVIFDASTVAKMAAHPTTQEWWAVCKPCHEPLPTRAPGEWWANMEEVFHTD